MIARRHESDYVRCEAIFSIENWVIAQLAPRRRRSSYSGAAKLPNNDSVINLAL